MYCEVFPFPWFVQLKWAYQYVPCKGHQACKKHESHSLQVKICLLWCSMNTPMMWFCYQGNFSPSFQSSHWSVVWKWDKCLAGFCGYQEGKITCFLWWLCTYWGRKKLWTWLSLRPSFKIHMQMNFWTKSNTKYTRSVLIQINKWKSGDSFWAYEFFGCIVLVCLCSSYSNLDLKVFEGISLKGNIVYYRMSLFMMQLTDSFIE